MTERRESPRTRCRLGCQIQRGKDRIRTRVLDVSENGICVVSPVEFKKKQMVEITIDIPGDENARLQAAVWHARKVRNKITGSIVWAAGMMVIKADDAYARLVAPEEHRRPSEAPAGEEDDDLVVFRVRVQRNGQSRTRLLTLAAATEDEARTLALADLDARWSVIEVHSALPPA